MLLTTREYILEQGLKKHADLREIIGKYKLECLLEEYSPVDKVRIYFGHLKRSNLTWEQLKQLFDAHKLVIDSPNYNPRVIEMFLKQTDPEESPQDCEDRFFSYLERPERFWEAIFEGLSREARIAYILLSTYPVPARLGALRESFCKVIDWMGNPVEWKDFGSTIAELEKTVIKTIHLPRLDTILVKFQNPSAYDFIYSFLAKNFRQYQQLLVQGCRCFEQYIYLLNYFFKELPDGEEYGYVLGKCIDTIYEPSIMSEYFREYITDNEWEYYEESGEEDAPLERYYKVLKCLNEGRGEAYHGFFTGLSFDRNDYMEFAVGALAEEYCRGFTGLTEARTAYGIMKDVELVIEVDQQGEVLGGQNSLSQLWMMLESLEITQVLDLVPDCFDSAQMSVIRQNFELVNGRNGEYYKVIFGKVEDVDIIEKMECVEPVLSEYRKICALCGSHSGVVKPASAKNINLDRKT